MTEVFVLFMETSDQRGTSEPVGVYSTESLAQAADGQVKKHRTYMKRFELNATPVPPRGYTL